MSRSDTKGHIEYAEPLACLPMEAELATLIVKTLHLECSPSDIDPTAPLFGDGLGLDSIDVLELSLALSKAYGLELKSSDPDNPQILSSLRALACHIERRRHF